MDDSTRKRQREQSPNRLTGSPSIPLSSPIIAATEAPFSDVDVYDEAIVDEDVIESYLLQDDEADLEGEDLFGDNLDADYQENARQDQYDVESADGEEYDVMDNETRQLVEAKLKRRDRERAKLEGRLLPAYLDEEEEEATQPMRFRRRHRQELEPELYIDDEMTPAHDLESLKDVKGSLSEYVSMDGPRQTIKSEFHRFLTSFVNEHGESVYGERIKAMCEANGESLEITWQHLYETSALLSFFVTNCPSEVIKIFDAVALEVVLSGFDEYAGIKNEIHVRIAGIPPTDTLRDLRQMHLNTLVKVTGVVTRRTGVFPQLKYVKYDCVKCGALLGPFYQDSHSEIRIGSCPNCQSRGPFNVNSEQTIYRNYQRMTLQESPGSVPAGRLPRHKDLIMLWDLTDCARPGDEIEVTGIYKNNFDVSLNTKNGFPVFATVIEVNHVCKRQDEFASTRLTEDDLKSIRELSKDPRIKSRIIKSMAPSIFGHEDIKTALALSMFGGVFKNPQGKHRIRGDINVLMLGDPGTAKSQFLKYVEKTSHRSVYTTGQGASAVGLTASVHKDPVTREWTLEGGALVMADKGVCLIDEFDKMGDRDRTSIHEAMEQQSISISKAGIVTSLQARCAVIAAANPLFGKYNAQIPFSQNVELTEPILSRFDILCVVQDTCDPILDERLARFVVGSHMRSHPSFEGQVTFESQDGKAEDDIIPQDLLKKYIMFARDKVYPKINNIDHEKLEKLYSELRQESMIGGSIPITVRYLESIIRMSEAFARMHLRDFVRQDDIDHAIAATIKSFISAQKHSVKKTLGRVFDKYLTVERDNFELLTHVLSEMEKDFLRFNYFKTDVMPDSVEMDMDDFESRARELNIHNLAPFYESRAFSKNFKINWKKRIIQNK